MFQKKSVDGAGESVGRAALIQSRSPAALLHTSHINTLISRVSAFTPICLHRPSQLKKEAVYTLQHSSGPHSQSGIADRLVHFICFSASTCWSRKREWNWKNRQSNKCCTTELSGKNTGVKDTLFFCRSHTMLMRGQAVLFRLD